MGKVCKWFNGSCLDRGSCSGCEYQHIRIFGIVIFKDDIIMYAPLFITLIIIIIGFIFTFKIQRDFSMSNIISALVSSIAFIIGYYLIWIFRID